MPAASRAVSGYSLTFWVRYSPARCPRRYRTSPAAVACSRASERLDRLHLTPAELYRQKTAELHAALADRELRAEAFGLICSLIECVQLHPLYFSYRLPRSQRGYRRMGARASRG